MLRSPRRARSALLTFAVLLIVLPSGRPPPSRSCAAMAGRCGRWRFRRRANRDFGKFRFDRDPLVADAQCGRAGAALPCRRRQRGRAAAGWPRGDRGRRRTHRDLDFRQDPARRRAGRPYGADRWRSRYRPMAQCWPRRHGIRPCGCGRLRVARRACSKGIRRTSTAWRLPPTAARWSASATIRAFASGRSRARQRRPSLRCRARSTRSPSAAMARSRSAAPTAGCTSWPQTARVPAT